MHRALVLAIAAVLAAAAGRAEAQPRGDERDAGFIGGSDRALPLEIDDCPAVPPELTDADLRARAIESYSRGETLYIQGDYEGAVREMVTSYCLTPFYSILKDIGQAYERKLDYERAIAYLSRYIERIPPGAKRLKPCDPEPDVDRENVSRRIEVLRQLKAQLFVQTDVPGAKITIQNDAGVKGRGASGDTLEVPAGVYDMLVERDGYEPLTRRITIKIGKPYTFFVSLVPLKGRLSVQVAPADARVFLGDQLIGIGRAEKILPGGRYTISTEAQGRTGQSRDIEILPNRVNRLQIDLAPLPQFGRRQLIVYSAFAGATATGTLLSAFDNTGISTLGTLVGATAGLAGSYFYLPDAVSLGTSNLTITGSLAGAVAGASGSLLFTGRSEIVQPMTGLGLILGAGAGYYLGDALDVRPGDAALINSAALWGTAAGGLFALSFGPPRNVSAGLVLSGLGVGAISGGLLSRYYDISRTHAVLIDIGGIAGVIGGLATESIVNPVARGSDDEVSDREREHLANYALAGMGIGLITAGILTRNVDAPKVPVRATTGTVTDVAGKSTMTYGFSGTW